MTWIDVASVALFVVVGYAESKRGFSPAVLDLLLVLLGLNVAKLLAGALQASLGSQTVAFAVLFLVVVVVTAVLSTIFDTYTKWEIGPYDKTVAAVLGAVTGLAVAHGLYYAMALHGSGGHALVARSMLAPEVYDLRTLHAIGSMFQHLGGGPRIVDEVNKQQK